MDIFEYLPQLIVAYDGNDEFANLIHIKKADKDNDYYCPCCGGIVKPRALDSGKEQSHYYHKTGKCTKESQLHFFCKNWLFEQGSKFYINDKLFEVSSIDVEKAYSTPFGSYKPDISVNTTSGVTIYFEMFFSNRKTGDDYFCKWNYLGNDVVEINIKEYMFKTDFSSIPIFTYLYHDGVCYSKTYEKRDLYATTIAKIKRELTRQKVLNYRARIEQLDWFWQKIRNNETRESILETVEAMEYEDMLSCYSIIKQKQCVSYLKNDVLNIINQKVIADVRESLGLPYDENVYFDLKHIRGRTYEAGIRLNIKTSHITYNDFYIHCDEYRFDRTNDYPKIVFRKNIHTKKEIVIPEEAIVKLKQNFEDTVEYKEKLINYDTALSALEGDDYKIRVKNNIHTVLAKVHSENFEVLFNDYYTREFDTEELYNQIHYKIKEMKDKEYVNAILNDDDCLLMISNLQNYKNFGCQASVEYEGNKQRIEKSGVHFKLYVYTKCIYDKVLESNFDDFIRTIDDCKQKIDDFIKDYGVLISLVDRINNCKNGFWEAEFLFDYGDCPKIKVDQKRIEAKSYYYSTFEKINLCDFTSLSEEDIVLMLENAMKKVIKNMEKYGCRVMEEI